MGAWLDLREIDLFKETWKKGERLDGIYIIFEHPSGEELGFGINASMGKIMFRKFASEEVKFVIDEARTILEL
jgi:hypothetical protein